MLKKTFIALLMTSLALSVACESELDGKTAATVHEGSDESADEVVEEVEEAVEELVTRDVAFHHESSKIEWLGAKVTGDHDGGFTEWEAEANVDSDNKLKSVDFTVQTASLWSDTDRLTGHLKNDDFFDVENYPKATFESTSIEEGVEQDEDSDATHTVTGEMTIKETTKTISFPVTASVEDDVMNLSSEFTLMRFDFGVDYKGQADDLIRDEVLLKLDFNLPLMEEAVVEGTEEGEEAAEEETDEG